MIHLGVNIDHIATLRNARGGKEPSVIQAAAAAAQGGADSITVHLREDRRHILDEDVKLLDQLMDVPLNLEMSLDEEIVEFALELCPPQVTLVPEKRQEMTTESGLDVIRYHKQINQVSERFREKGVRVSLFVDPDVLQLQACLKTTSRTVELHTGDFANASSPRDKIKEIHRLEKASLWCLENDVQLHAGHGLNYHNTSDLLHLPQLRELNIGHSIVSRAVFSGLEKAVSDMRQLLNTSEHHQVTAKTQTLVSSSQND
jgi:pyridoxine 5-phosphate synthase